MTNQLVTVTLIIGVVHNKPSQTTIAINQALQASGIQVDGFEYEWVYKNGNANWFSGQQPVVQYDPFEIEVECI